VDHDPIYHLFLFAISTKDSATSGRCGRRSQRCRIFAIVFGQKHFYLNPSGSSSPTRCWIAVAVGAITLLVATTAAFAISRSKSRRAHVLNLALFTTSFRRRFSRADVQNHGNYGLLNSQWADCGDDRGAVLHLGVEADFGKCLRADEAARSMATSPAATVPPLCTSFDGAVAGGGGDLFVAARLERILYAFLAVVQRHSVTLRVALGNFLSAGRFALELLMATGLIYALPPAAIYYAFKRYMWAA